MELKTDVSEAEILIKNIRSQFDMPEEILDRIEGDKIEREARV